MKYNAEFLNSHNILGIVEDLLIQPVDSFHREWSKSVEQVAQVCWDILQRYNHLLQGDDSACIEQNLPRNRLLSQDLECLRNFAKSLWRSLTNEAQETLWLEWLKAGLVKIAEYPTNSAALGKVIHA